MIIFWIFPSRVVHIQAHNLKTLNPKKNKFFFKNTPPDPRNLTNQTNKKVVYLFCSLVVVCSNKRKFLKRNSQLILHSTTAHVIRQTQTTQIDAKSKISKLNMTTTCVRKMNVKKIRAPAQQSFLPQGEVSTPSGHRPTSSPRC